MSKRKPHNDEAGYVAEKIFLPTGSHIVIYKAVEQGIDVGGDKYAVVCSLHGTITSDNNIPGARLSMKHPAFCEACMERSLEVGCLAGIRSAKRDYNKLKRAGNVTFQALSDLTPNGTQLTR